MVIRRLIYTICGLVMFALVAVSVFGLVNAKARYDRERQFLLVFGLGPTNGEVSQLAVNSYFDDQMREICAANKARHIVQATHARIERVTAQGDVIAGETKAIWRAQDNRLLAAENVAVENGFMPPQEYLAFKTRRLTWPANEKTPDRLNCF